MPSLPEVLAQVPLFQELSPDDLDEIAGAAQPESYAEGEHVFHIGEPGRSLFIVTEGTVQVHHPNREGHFELAQFGPGDFFGEMALLNDAPRSATARALTPVEALVVDKVDFRRILAAKPEVALKILQAMSVRVRSADEIIQGLTNHAVRDPLTGLLNRRAFNERMDEEVARTRRYGGSFSLILLDLDDFESVNERLGRDVGDRILAWVGRLLTEHTRGSDVPFRFSDDTFTVLCPWTASEFARAVASRLSTLLSEAKAPIEGSVSLSVSTGTSTCPTDGQEPQSLYHSAQRALQARRG